jgi:hypothetical protein
MFKGKGSNRLKLRTIPINDPNRIVIEIPSSPFPVQDYRIEAISVQRVTVQG